MVCRQLILLIITVNGPMLISCQGCDPSDLGQKGNYEFCKTNNSSSTGIGYKYFEDAVVFCFIGKHAFAGDEALAHCPSGYEIKGASKAICQTYGFWVQQPAQELWPTCKLKVNNNFEVTPSHPMTTIIYVTGILAYVSGYVLMSLSECHREHIFGRRSTASFLTCLPCLGPLTVVSLTLWFLTHSFGDDESRQTDYHCLYAAYATSLVYMVCSVFYFILVRFERRCKLSSSSREHTTSDPYIDATSNSMSLEIKDKTPLLNRSPETQCEPFTPTPQYDTSTLTHDRTGRQLEESPPPSYERVVNHYY